MDGWRNYVPTEVCGNGDCTRDDDCDGLDNYNDPNCAEGNPSAATNTPRCTDGIDNDCDGMTDWADTGCCGEEGDSCTKNTDCCDYSGNAGDPYCDSYSATCQTSADCTEGGYYQLCWNNFCIDVSQNKACCPYSMQGITGLSGGSWVSGSDGVSVIW
ncbi:hypothetical protein JW998_15795 [candidate division KSB1 bacterium]|nr:hypothetical protein [candidate division KSB1 bacterium]